MCLGFQPHLRYVRKLPVTRCNKALILRFPPSLISGINHDKAKIMMINKKRNAGLTL